MFVDPTFLVFTRRVVRASLFACVNTAAANVLLLIGAACNTRGQLHTCMMFLYSICDKDPI